MDLKHNVCILSFKQSFVPMLDYMVLKLNSSIITEQRSFVPMLDYMVLKPQTQILVSVHKPHFSVAKSTVLLY